MAQRSSPLSLNPLPIIVALILLALFVFAKPSWIFLLQMLLVLTVIVLVVRDEVLGLLALVLLRPAVDVLGSSVLVSVQGVSLNVAATFSLIAIPWAAYRLIVHRANLRATPLFWPILAFVFVCALGVVTSVAPRVSIEEFVRFSSIFFLYFLAYHIIVTPHQARLFRQAFALSLVAPVAAGIFEFVTQRGLTFGEFSNRIFGTFGHPNVFAFYLVLALALFLGQVSLSPKRVRRGLVIGLGLLVVLLGLTLTRGAWVGLAIVLATFGFVRHRRLVAAVALILVMGGILFPLVNRISTEQFNVDIARSSLVRKLTDTQSEDSSYRFRVQLWREMSPKFWERPVLGHGLGSFTKLREQQIFNFFEGTEAHNDYLRLAVETGVAGLLAYIVLIGAVIRRLARVVQHVGGSPIGVQALGLLGFTLALIFMSAFDNMLQATAVMWVYWMALAVTLRQAAYAKV
jgi:O-antigen ligase